MTNPFMRPPTGFGPGSQPLGQQDDALEYMPLPQDMRTYAPRIPEMDALTETDLTPALELLRDVSAAAGRVAAMGGSERIDLAPLDAANRALIAETLGSGEVAAKVRAIPAIAVQESVFAGIWMLKSADADQIEVAAIPSMHHGKRLFAASRGWWSIHRAWLWRGQRATAAGGTDRQVHRF